MANSNRLNEAIFMASHSMSAPMQNMERKPEDTVDLVEKWMSGSKFSHVQESVETDTIEGFPEWAVNYAYYGEDYNLSDEEKKEVDDFLAKYDVKSIKGVVEDGPSGFTYYPAFGKGGNTCTVII